MLLIVIVLLMRLLAFKQNQGRELSSLYKQCIEVSISLVSALW